MKLIVELTKGILPFYIGKPIEEYKSKYSFNFIKGEIDENWDEYDFFENTIEIYVSKTTDKIESIGCRYNCYLDDINLIGLNIEEFFLHYKIDKSKYKFEKIFLIEEEQFVYDLPDIGLQLWVNSFNKIVTVFVTD